MQIHPSQTAGVQGLRVGHCALCSGCSWPHAGGTLASDLQRVKPRFVTDPAGCLSCSAGGSDVTLHVFHPRLTPCDHYCLRRQPVGRWVRTVCVAATVRPRMLRSMRTCACTPVPANRCCDKLCTIGAACTCAPWHVPHSASLHHVFPPLPFMFHVLHDAPQRSATPCSPAQ